MKNKIILLQFAIILIMGIHIATLNEKIECVHLIYQIKERLNSDEAKALEKWNENVRAALNERGIQETGVCSDQW
jgi:hypothetical protein